MAISVLSALEIDQKSPANQLTLVEENNTSDASFIVSSFLEQALKKKQKIIILLFHNSFGHYHAISQKLGYNLLEHRESGDVFVYDFLKTILDGISANGSLPGDEFILRDLFMEIRGKIVELSASNDVTLVIDNVGNLVLLGFPLKTVIFFMHYCRTLLYDFKNVTIVCLTHNFLDNEEFKVFINGLRYVSYLNVVVDDLKSGRATDVTGKFSVAWRTEDHMQWEEPNEFHYQLLDKNINVFIPGMKNL